MIGEITESLHADPKKKTGRWNKVHTQRHTHPPNKATVANLSKIVQSTRDKVLRYMNPWGPVSIKPSK